jgi:hypothetical protein
LADHPITPSPELVEQWRTEGFHQDYCSPFEHAIAQAARWGADQELEACVKWVNDNVPCGYGPPGEELRTARRPKPPSLKEQALKALEVEDDSMPLRSLERGERFDTIRRALEQLDD